MNRLTIRLAIVLAILLMPGVALSQSLTGTITGKVVDEQGGVLPGVSVTLTGKTGSQTQVTDDRGEFRFVGLTPGMFEVKSELQGFRPKVDSNLDLAIGKTIDLKVTMSVGGLTESVDVVANAVTIDTTTTATDTTISQDLLFAMPISRTNAAVNMLNYSPGVNSGSAFGGASDGANALLLDGVDTRDPEGGTAWTFFNYNIIDEVQVGALGQPAEYGGFTGAVVNTITKSGGNKYSSLFEYRYTSKDFRGDNITSAIKGQNPTLKATGVDKLNDYTVQMGGPLKKDKAFFFASIQRYSVKQDPDGPRTVRTEVSPRFNVKFTVQPTPNDNIIGSLQYDNYNQTGRTGFGGASLTTDDRTIEQDSPEYIWNAQYRRVFGSSTFFEVKFTGYWGYYDLTPITNLPARLDGESGEYSGGAGYNAQYDRTRNQINASLSKYADFAGSHNFKFGAEIERSSLRNRYEYTDGLFFYDYGGLPYLAYAYSYDIEGRNDRVSFYGQDQWKIGRMTANVGVRLDSIKGVSVSDDKEMYSTFSTSPRLGIAYDVFGKGTSVLRGFWGQLYDGAVFSSWSRAVPGISDYVIYEVSPSNQLTEIDRVSGASKYTVASDMKHPRTDEFNISFEQQLLRNFKFTGTYIRRDWKNFINSTLVGGTWSPFAYTNPLTNQSMSLYRWANRSIGQKFLIQNTDEVSYRDPSGNIIGTSNAYRKYDGFMAVLTKAYSNRWQAQVSYVYSKTKGTVTNSTYAGISSGQFETPNTILINADGPVGYDRTHELKVFGGYQIPLVEVSANVYYRMLSGTPWTPYQRVSSGTVNWTGSVDVLLEPRGNRRNENVHIVDARFEKVFNFGVHRFGVYADIENLLNASTITGVQGRNPSASISGNTILLGNATSVAAARQLTFGGRWSF